MRSIIRFVYLITMAGSIIAQEQATVEIRGSSDVRAVCMDDSLHDPVFLPLVLRTNPGQHVVHLYGRERAIYEPSDYSVTFHLTAGEVKIIEGVVNGMGTVNSTPRGASVWLDDSLAGDTPLWMALGSLKDRRIVFKKSGYEDVQVTIGDTAIAQNRLRISLRPTNGFAEPDNEFLSPSWKYRGVGRHRGWLMAASVTGLVAAYYKIKADHLFEKAKTARRQNNAALEASLRKKTRRFDRYSTIGFIGLQVSFTGAIYFLLKSE